MTVSQAQVTKYRSWLVNNPDKHGTEDYKAVWTAYSESFDQAAPSVPVQPEPQVRSDTYADYMERVREIERNRPPPPPPTPSNDDFNPATYKDQWAPRRGLSRGLDTAEQLYGEFIDSAGHATGIEALEQYGKEIIDYNTKQLAAQEIATPSTSFKDVREADGVFNTLDTGATWAAEQLPQQLGLMGGTIAGGVAGALLAKPLALGVAGAAALSTAGSLLAQYPLLAGGNWAAQKEAIASGERAELSPAAAWLAALPQTALDVFSAKWAALGGGPLSKLFTESGGGILTRITRTGAKGVLYEVPTEIGQEIIERVQAGQDPWSDEAIEQYIEAGAAAALVGGTLGGGRGALSKPEIAPQDKPEGEPGTDTTPPVTPADVTAQDLRDVGVEDEQLSALRTELATAETKNKAREAEDTQRKAVAAEESAIAKVLRGELLTDLEKEITARADIQERIIEARKIEETVIAKRLAGKPLTGAEAKIAARVDTQERIVTTPAMDAEVKIQAAIQAEAQAEVDAAEATQAEVDAAEIKIPPADTKKRGKRNASPVEETTQADVTPQADAQAEVDAEEEAVIAKVLGGKPLTSGEAEIFARVDVQERIAKAAIPTITVTPEFLDNLDIAKQAGIRKRLEGRVLTESELRTEFAAFGKGREGKTLGISQKAVAAITQQFEGRSKDLFIGDAPSQGGITLTSDEIKQQNEWRVLVQQGERSASTVEETAPADTTPDPKGTVTESVVTTPPEPTPQADTPLESVYAAEYADIYSRDPIEAENYLSRLLDGGISEEEATNIRASRGTTPASAGTVTEPVVDTPLAIREQLAKDKTKREAVEAEENNKVIVPERTAAMREDARNAAAAQRAEDLKLPNITEYGSFEIDDTTGVREKTDVEAESTATKIDTEGLSETQQTKLDTTNKESKSRIEAENLQERRKEALLQENEAIDKVMEPDPEAVARRTQNEAKQQVGTEPQKVRRIAAVVEAVGVAPNGGVGKRLATALKPVISGTQAQIHTALNTFKETLPAKSKFRAGIDTYIEQDKKRGESQPAGVSNAPAPAPDKQRLAAAVDPVPKDIEFTEIEEQELIAQRDAALALYADYSLGSKEELPLLHEALVEAAMPIEDVGIQEAIAEKDLQLVMRRLGDSLSILKSFSLRRIAKALARHIGDTTQVVLVDRLETAGGKLAASSYDPDTDTVYLHINKGLNVHGLLHETTHALTVGELSNLSSPITKQLTKIFNDTKEYLGTAYGSSSLEEFVAEAFSNQEFRMQLARINPEGKPLSALRRFMNSIRRFLNRIIGTSFNDSDTLSLVDTLITGILAPAPKNRNSEMFAENSTQEGVEKLIKRIIDEPVKAMQNRVNVENKAAGKRPRSKEGSSFGEKSIEFLNDTTDRGREFFWSTMDDNRFEDVARAMGEVPGKLFRTYHRSVTSIRGEMETFDAQMNLLIKTTSDWRAKAGEKGVKLLNDLALSQVFGATIYKANPLLDEASALEQYGADSEQMTAWLAQRPIVKQLEALKFNNKTGMQIYADIQGRYKKTLQELLDAVVGTEGKTGFIDDMFEGQVGKEEEIQTLKDDVIKRMFDKDFQETYFPLIRQGHWKVQYRLKDSEKFNPDTDGAYNMEMVETEAEAKRLRASLNENDNVVDGSVTIKDSRLEPRWYEDAVPANGFVNSLLKQAQKQQSETKAGPEGDIQREALAGMEEMIVETFLNTLPETSFAQSLRKRDETPGYVHDVLEGLQTKGYDIGRQAKRIKGLSKVNKIAAEIAGLQYDNKYTIDKTGFKEFQAEVQRRAAFVRNPPKDTVWKNLNQFAFVYTIGFNVSSALVNLSQIPLFVAPYLGAKYGYKNTLIALGKATSLVGSSGELSTNLLGLDAYYEIDDNGELNLNEELAPEHMHKELLRMRPMLNKLRDTGMLKKGGYGFENLNIDDAAKQLTRANKWWHKDTITAFSAIAFNAAERFNRQTTSIAAYQLELQALEEAHDTVKPLIENGTNPKSIEKAKEKLRGTAEYADIQEAAAEYAYYTTLETNGGPFLETSAPITKQGIKRTAFMYKGYGMKMNHTMLKAAKAAIWDAYPGDTEASVAARKEALKMLLGWHGSTLFFAGVSGMPIYGAVKALADIWLDDDEEDFDSIVRRYVDEGMFKGAFNAMLGMDVASRVKLTDLILQDNRYNSGASTTELIGVYLGGPALSSATRAGRGFNDMFNGEWLRGFESVVPPGIANATLKIARVVSDDGYTTRRNDPIYDDVTTGELFGQMFGFAPTEYKRRQEEVAIKKKISRDITEQRSEIMGDLYQAIRMGDNDAYRDTVEDMYDYNARHPYYPITLTSLKRSVKGNMKTTANSHYGASFSPIMQRAFDEYIFAEQRAYSDR